MGLTFSSVCLFPFSNMKLAASTDKILISFGFTKKSQSIDASLPSDEPHKVKHDHCGLFHLHQGRQKKFVGCVSAKSSNSFLSFDCV